MVIIIKSYRYTDRLYNKWFYWQYDKNTYVRTHVFDIDKFWECPLKLFNVTSLKTSFPLNIYGNITYI